MLLPLVLPDDGREFDGSLAICVIIHNYIAHLDERIFVSEIIEKQLFNIFHRQDAPLVIAVGIGNDADVCKGLGNGLHCVSLTAIQAVIFSNLRGERVAIIELFAVFVHSRQFAFAHLHLLLHTTKTDGLMGVGC